MRPGRSLTALVVCAGWLALTTGYAVAAEPQVDLGGTPVPGGSGSTDQAHPTVLDPGLWTDSLGDANSPYRDHFFRYERRIQGSTVHIGVIGESSDDADGFDLTATGPQQTDCGSASASPNDSSVPQAVFGAALTVGASAVDDVESPCLTGDAIDIKLERSTPGSSSSDELPVAIKVVEEAPIVHADELRTPPGSPTYHRIEVSGGDQVTGTASFATAPKVVSTDGSADFSTTVTEGEERLFRIPLDWGQAVSVAAHAPKMDKRTYEHDRGYEGVDVSLQLIGPARDSVTSAVGNVTTTGSYDEYAALDLSDALPEVDYLNRFNSLPADVPGDYWLAIAASPKPDDVDTPLGVPLDVAVEVTTHPDAAPSYSGGVLAQGGGKYEGSYDPSAPFLVAPDQFSAFASGSPAPADEDSSWWGPRRYAGLALVAAGAASCAAGLWRLRRR